MATTWYEQRKIAVALAALARPRYDLGWDCACGTGELAGALADRCDAVVASDGSAEAVRLTRQRTGPRDSVHCVVNRLPDLPALAVRPSLVVVSEVLYYLDAAARSRTCAALAATARDEVVCVNWRHEPPDAYLSGADAVDELDASLTDTGWRGTVRHDDVDFVLAAWQRGTAAS